MKNSQFIILLFIGLAIFSCQEEFTADLDQTYHLRHKGADMPIWVRGNLSSNVIILFLHGGPGSGSLPTEEYFRSLQDRYVVALWDQRASGGSNGEVDRSILSHEQFAEDGFYVIQLLRQEYPDHEIFLMGHSFGVELGYQFLVTEDWQNLVKGYLVVNGTHSSPTYLFYQREWVLREALLQDRPDILEWAQNNPVDRSNTSQYDQDQLFDYADELGNGAAERAELTSVENLTRQLFATPNQVVGNLLNNSIALTDPFAQQAREWSVADQLDEIEVPVALMWGVNDWNVVLENGLEADSLLTNAETTFIRFEESQHAPYVTENEKFTEEAAAFIERYRN